MNQKAFLQFKVLFLNLIGNNQEKNSNVNDKIHKGICLNVPSTEQTIPKHEGTIQSKVKHALSEYSTS